MPIENIENLLLYRDALMLVLNKPAGIPVHKGKGGGETLEQYFDALRFGLPRLPALAHRLDRDTSGCLVLGRHRKALQRLSQLFKNNRIEKTYWAIVQGTPEPEGDINLPLGKLSDRSDDWRMCVRDDGQEAKTVYKLLGSAGDLSWVEMRPFTGRTHQLRVHAQAMGWPIMGDKIYGSAGTQPLHLHAASITIPLYPKKPAITIHAPPPEHMLAALRDCGYTPA